MTIAKLFVLHANAVIDLAFQWKMKFKRSYFISDFNLKNVNIC